MSNLILSSCGRYLCDENTGEILEYSPAYVVRRLIELFKENKTFFLECFQELAEVDPDWWEFQEIDDPDFCQFFCTTKTVKALLEDSRCMFFIETADNKEILDLMEYYPHAVQVWSALTSL